MSRTGRLAAALLASVLVAGCSSTTARLDPDPSRIQVTARASDEVAGYRVGEHELFTDATSPDRQQQLSSAARPAGFTQPPTGQGRQRYLDQKLVWRDCGERSCATVVVPLDWDDPDGPAITLALRRASATAARQGSLFVNPGGPGVGALELVDRIGADQLPGYDVIAWDPRGSGESTPVVCGSTAQHDAYRAVDMSPETPQEWTAFQDASKAFAAQCRQNSGDLLDHISTIDTARDLDYLRHLVGDDTLNYLGISYGTFIGSTYAELYPGRVGRMVLDSAVNITRDDSVGQATGFEQSLRSFAQWCSARDCAGLGSSTDEVMASVKAFLTGLDSRPIGSGGRTLTQTLGAVGLITFLYGGEAAYPSLAQAIRDAQQGDPAWLVASADLQDGRNADGSYDPSAGAFPAIGCLDNADEGLAGAKRDWPVWQRKAPVVGYVMGPNLMCTYWTAKPADQLVLRARGSAPIVVLGVTGDPATPYQQAVWMAEQLESAVLVTWRGQGHSAWFLGNECVKAAVKGYLNNGTVPADQTTC